MVALYCLWRFQGWLPEGTVIDVPANIKIVAKNTFQRQTANTLAYSDRPWTNYG
jgi:hypothetical protein